MTEIIRRHIRYNFTVNVLDGAFFGFALGLASYVTVIPLFISTLTDSTAIIGFIATTHMIGWQFPQLLTSNRVSRLARYKPMVMWMTFQERWPFFGLALAALLLPTLGKNLTLLLTFIMVLFQSLGGGFTGTAWQSMIGKLIPISRRGLFYGMQSAAANLLSSIGAVITGIILAALAFPGNYAASFFLAGMSMMISMIFLGLTREPAHEVRNSRQTQARGVFRAKLLELIKHDDNFRYFLIAKIGAQVASIAVSFYTIYGVRQFDMSPDVAGVLTGVFLFAGTFTSPIMGLLGDRWGHRRVFQLGMVIMTLSTGMAIFAPDLSWFIPIYILAAAFNSVNWTTINAMTVEFGTIEERPFYIGLSNTLVAPATLVAPLIGGWLADSVGFGGTFTMCAIAGILTLFVLLFLMRDPIPKSIESRIAMSTSSE